MQNPTPTSAALLAALKNIVDHDGQHISSARLHAAVVAIEAEDQTSAVAGADAAQSAIETVAIPTYRWETRQDSYEAGAASAAGYLQYFCHKASFDAGWWVDKTGASIKANPYCFSNKLALIHSEISEAMEGDRKGLKDDHLPHRDMREVELADALIRIFDLAGAYEMDIGGALAEKMAYNARRADHKPAARASAGGKTY